MPHRALFLLATLLALATTGAHASSTGVPSAGNSIMPPCLVTCPLGDISFAVTVLDLANNPVGGASVVLEFADCPDAVFCKFPPPPYDLNLAARTVRLFADAAGHVVFPLRIGGVCGPDSVKLFANGVLLKRYALASPDQDASLFVFAGTLFQDWSTFLGKVGTSDPTADFNCDGDVDLNDGGMGDSEILGQHSCHSCDGCVDSAKRTTWGRVKTIHR